ncbi:serine/threonine-protein kinase [Mycolicibacterium parafortuitum]|uniref:non-specific serine/threonine protein kinase n=1 Tax=Mycolicibacterium parafortuitum TaxID=39692 RepID=A0A375YG54_MYCPF|nr:serine/threonine-protein kinase [Mycolicibacterium parafortuitum]ORB28807.1 serine/threonine protein kinase [Mycolicibacterium parafortuitum]SRX80091.1 protein kinase [Rhodococcus jostii RHA1] [Mycolicibacterium parafortuitum]
MGTPQGGARLGTRFGPYELHSVIGVGGMGEVYRAYDTARERMVAIKLLRPEMAADRSFQDRFRRESRVAARLQEPHVIPVHNFGEIDGQLYIDMRLVDGASLKEVLRNDGPLPPARAVAILRQVAAALDDAHANGLVHRDIKPENVLLTHDDFAYLVDFGIAHGGGEASVTSTGLVVGSSAYMAPERFSGERGGPASDIYSLACLLYESMTGRAPFEAADVRQVWSAHMFAPPPRPSIMRRGISRAFDDVIARGMAKDPAERYATAGELGRAAAAALAAVDAAPAPEPAATPPATRQFTQAQPTPTPAPMPPPPPPPGRRFTRGQLALIGAIVVLFTAAVILALVLVFSGGKESAPPRIAAPPQSSTETSASPESPNRSAVDGVSGTDSQGFVGHTARCDSGDTPAALIRTSLSLAIICEAGDGDYYYRGERLRDGANREIQGATRSGDGFTVTGSDGARYDVQPNQLTISSGGSVDSAEPALEWGSAD